MKTPAPAADANFGQRLSRTREARGLSVEDVAKSLRLRPSQIEALEESNLAKFPNAAYAKSFLVMYARFLKVDVSDYSEAIDTTKPMRISDFQYLTNRASDEDKNLKRAAQDARYDFVVPERGSRSWLPLIVAGGAVAVVAIIFGIWMNLSRIGKADPAASTPPPALADPAAAIAPVAPGTPATALADPAVPPRPVVVAPPVGTPPKDGSPGAEIPRAKAISPVATLASDDTAALQELDGPPKTETVEIPPAPVPEIAPEDEGLQLETKRKTWIVIRDGPGGVPVYEDYLYPNSRPMRLPAGKYFIELKEADAVQIRKDGKRLTYQSPGLFVQ